MNEQLLSPPESYPIPDTGLRNHEHTTYIGESIEEKKEFLVVTRNSLEILSSILNSEVEPKPIKVTLLSPFCWLCFTKLKILSSLWSSALHFFHFFYSSYSGHLSFLTPFDYYCSFFQSSLIFYYIVYSRRS